ncbi:MAG: PA0069 family radical SAM protein [Pseudomonadota bacterium]
MASRQSRRHSQNPLAAGASPLPGAPITRERLAGVDAPTHHRDTAPRKGRGAVSNRDGRFETYRHEPEDDGWGILEEPAPRVATTVEVDATRTILSRNDSPDIPFSRSINPYRGCEHGCIYCFARPTHTYLGFSAGLDFETRLTYKPEAAALLERELAHRNYRCEPIALGSNTDPYQPVERKFRVTRALLEVMQRHHQPVTIVTKSARVERDIDLLGAMAQKGLARVSVSITTLESRLARVMEPRATAPAARLRTITRLRDAGIPVTVLFSPIVPALNEPELERVLEAARAAGASDAGYALLRLPLEIEALFVEWLEHHFPDTARRTMARMRDMRGGQAYESTFGVRMRGRGVFAELLAKRFDMARRRLGFASPAPLRTDLFTPPAADDRQMTLF